MIWPGVERMEISLKKYGLVGVLFASVLSGCGAGDPNENGDSMEGDDVGVAQDAVTIFPPMLSFYVPPHTGGDREFKGHGPVMTITVDLMVVNDNELYAAVYIDALETKRDWTHASGTAHQFVYRAPRRIISVGPPTHFEHTYTDTDHARDVFTFPPQSSAVKMLTCVGDTSGDEAGTRTGCEVELHPITVTLSN